jgi:tripartite motif-containing protein 71
VGEFHWPWGIAFTSDSTLVFVVESSSGRVQVLRLGVSADGSDATLEHVRFIGTEGKREGQLSQPRGIALRRVERGHLEIETMLVAEFRNDRVSEFDLDGNFVRTFGAGSGSEDGKFLGVQDVTVLPSGEIATVDANNHRVSVFDADGIFLRKFGGSAFDLKCDYGDGLFEMPCALLSDAYGHICVLDPGRLQVFTAEGVHLCSRSDLGINDQNDNACRGAIAWHPEAGLAVANGVMCSAMVWLR